MNDISNRFDYHPPKDALTVQAHEEVRDRAKAFALWLEFLLPVSRERSTAITKVEEAMFWANAAIARNSQEA